jgi:hypothetical protein
VLPCKPAVLLLGTCAGETKVDVHLETCMGMFIAVLLVRNKNWKQPKWPSNDEWENRV